MDYLKGLRKANVAYGEMGISYIEEYFQNKKQSITNINLLKKNNSKNPNSYKKCRTIRSKYLKISEDTKYKILVWQGKKGNSELFKDAMKSKSEYNKIEADYIRNGCTNFWYE